MLQHSGVPVRIAVFTLLIVAVVCVHSQAPIHAQTTFGSITGVVTDPSGAAVPRAAVTVINGDTGFTRTDLSSAGGVFIINDLLPGPYRVRVEGKGSSVQERDGVTLDANHVVNVDFRLS